MSQEVLPAKSVKESKPAVALNADQARHVKKIHYYHAACVKGFNQQMGYAFLTGMELHALKESLPHGQFEAVCAQHFPRINERTLQRYHKFFTGIKELKLPSGKSDIVSLLSDGKAVNSKGKLTKDGEAAMLKAIFEIADGKSLTEMYRDLGVIRRPKPDGGFRPPEKEVQEWLKANHPELAGTKFSDLPAPIQKAFRKQYRPAPPEALTLEGKRAAMMSAAKEFAEALDAKHYAACTEQEREEILTLCQDAAKLLKETLKTKEKK